MTPVIRIRIDFAENVNVGPGKIAMAYDAKRGLLRL